MIARLQCANAGHSTSHNRPRGNRRQEIGYQINLERKFNFVYPQKTSMIPYKFGKGHGFDYLLNDINWQKMS